MGVLAMLELDGDTDALLSALGELGSQLGTPPGLLVRIIAPTQTGVALFQLWQSAEARERNAADPHHREALQASGVLALSTARRSRVFEGAELEPLGIPEG
jgi:hypothetical protein